MMRALVLGIGLLAIGAQATEPDRPEAAVSAVSMMGLADMQRCGEIALALEVDRDRTRQQMVKLSARGKSISAEDKAIGARRKTVDLKSPEAVTTFNKRLNAQSQSIATYNSEVANLRTAQKAFVSRLETFNVACSRRIYDPALLAQLPPESQRALADISTKTTVPVLFDAGADISSPEPGMPAAPPVNLSGTTVLRPQSSENASIADLQTAATNGDADAQFRIGQAYLTGQGVRANIDEAIGWFERAATANHAKALFALSRIYYDGTVAIDEKRALAYLTRAADSGLADAEHNLGIWYSSDRNGRADLPRAIMWMNKAAVAGDPESQFVLAELLQRTPDANKRADEALAWMRRSADQGFRPAQKAMGDRYMHGKGVQEDKVEALKWYLLAAGQTRVDAAQSCVRLLVASRESREAAESAVVTAQRGLAPEAVAMATRRADDWVVSFKATKVGGC